MSKNHATHENADATRQVPAAVKALHTALIRRTNDTHIFAEQALKLLRREQERYESSKKSTHKPCTVYTRRSETRPVNAARAAVVAE